MTAPGQTRELHQAEAPAAGELRLRRYILRYKVQDAASYQARGGCDHTTRWQGEPCQRDIRDNCQALLH